MFIIKYLRIIYFAIIVCRRIYPMKTSPKFIKNKQVSKELISKLYFSRTQEGYFKKYGTQNKYLAEIGELMPRVSKKKMNKITQEVKQVNHVFRKYLQKKNINKLRIEDIVQFEGGLQIQSKRMMENTGMSKHEAQLKQLNNDIIRIGFMMILQKMENDKLNSFISENNYLKENIQRQKDNLNRLGYEYLGVKHPQEVKNIPQQLKFEQKENGSFHFIGHKTRKQASTVFQVSNYLKSIIPK